MSTATEAVIDAQIAAACRRLHLPTIASRARAMSGEALRGGESHLGFLAALLEAELEDRTERRRHRRIAEAHFPRLKRLEDFNFEEAPQIPAAKIRELAGLGFIDRAEPLILVGESGTGKSHLAIALGIAACMQSRQVRFVTTAGLVNELREARDDRSLSRLVARYARIEVLILDELAYVPLAPADAELLFQVLDERSELHALITTTNLPFGEWTKIFPEPRLCKAVVDRLTFNAHIIETGTQSWRFKKTLERHKATAAPGIGAPS
ncbi:MAG: IS21-like element helper ATPase IstB [Actinomycetota bacterium]